MRIEEEINQTKPFKSEFHKTAINLIFTSNWLASRIKVLLKPHDITMQQYNVLKILKGASKPISTSCIRGRMIERMADTSRLVERLCSKGWVNREACCSDKRLVDITLSQKGMQMVDEIEQEVDMSALIDMHLQPEEAKILSDLLDKMRG